MRAENHNDASLEEILRVHYQVMRAQTTAMRQAVLERPVPPPNTTKFPSPYVWRGRITRCLAGAAVVLIFATLATWSSLRPVTSWAQVAAAVQKQPWIHIVWDGGFRKGDTWIDVVRDCVAAKRDDGFEFDDPREGIHEFYDPRLGTIVRAPLEGESLKMDIQATRQITVELLTSVPDVGDWVYLVSRVKARRQATVEDGGRKWIDFTLDTVAEQQNWQIVVRVDPATRLPAQLTLKMQNGKEQVKCRFAYPANGPTDIYALGAPKAAKIIDCHPQGEVAEIRKHIREAEQRFGDYVAHIVRRTEWEPTLEIVRIWRQGARFRVETARPDVTDKDADFPAHQDDEAAWVARIDRRFTFAPTQLCDGKALYLRTPWSRPAQIDWKPLVAVGPGQQVERFLFEPGSFEWPHSYLFPERTYLCEVKRAENDPRPTNGPAGTVLVTSHLAETFDLARASTSEHWLDPKQGFACLKHRRVDPTLDKDRPQIWTREMDGLRQNPQGVWYPTIVRYSGGVLDENGKALMGESRLHVDFERAIPPRAFELSTEPLKD